MLGQGDWHYSPAALAFGRMIKSSVSDEMEKDRTFRGSRGKQVS